MRAHPFRGLLLSAAIACGSLLASAPALAAPRLEPVVSVSFPVQVTHAGDERLFIVELRGRVLIFDRVTRTLLPEPFLEIQSKTTTGGEHGLFSIAFHPDFAANGFFYVDYTNPAGETVIERYRVSADRNRADPDSATRLLRIGRPSQRHNGGQLQIGPNDGDLYIGMGDGGFANDPQCLAQRNETLLGKLLRLDVRQNLDRPPFYGIPPDNPYTGAADPSNQIPDEIWAFGLRNPWRFSFDRASGDLYIGDVGQDRYEEIDLHRASSPAGQNFGWKVMEGPLCFRTDECPAYTPVCNDPALTLPIHAYAHQGGDCAVTGGYVYRGDRAPEIAGRYVFGDLCSGSIRALREVSPGSFESEPLLNVAGGSVTSFGEDSSGSLYVTAGDQVYELVSDHPPTLPQVFAGLRKNGVEWIVNLGSHDSFPPAGISLDAARMPGAFSGSLLGSELVVVGTFDEDHHVAVPGSLAPVLRENLLFSGGADPSALSDAQLRSAFQRLAGSSDGWLDVWRARLPQRFQSAELPVGDPNSLASRLLGNDFGGQFPFSIAIPIADDRTLAAVFGAAVSAGTGLSALPREFNVAFPLKLLLDGRLAPVRPEDLKTQTYAVFAKNDTELIVNLGSHDDLPGAPLDIRDAVPAAFGPDGLVGAQVAVVGCFDEANERPNLMFSRSTTPATLDDAQIRAAFERLSGARVPAELGFLDVHSDLARGATRVLPAGDGHSFQTMFGCSAGGLSGFEPPAASLCLPISPGGVVIPVVGAALDPHELDRVQDITLTPPGAITARFRP